MTFRTQRNAMALVVALLAAGAATAHAAILVRIPHLESRSATYFEALGVAFSLDADPHSMVGRSMSVSSTAERATVTLTLPMADAVALLAMAPEGDEVGDVEIALASGAREETTYVRFTLERCRVLSWTTTSVHDDDSPVELELAFDFLTVD